MRNIDPAVLGIVRVQSNIEHNAQIEPCALHAENCIPDTRCAGDRRLLPTIVDDRKATCLFRHQKPAIRQCGQRIRTAVEGDDALNGKSVMFGSLILPALRREFIRRSRGNIALSPLTHIQCNALYQFFGQFFPPIMRWRHVRMTTYRPHEFAVTLTIGQGAPDQGGCRFRTA